MINEKKLIEEVKKHRLEYKDSDTAIGVNVVIELIEQQPKIDWVSCEERLPEDGESVLVWFEYFRYGEYNRLFQTIGISYTWNGAWSGFVNGSSGWSQLKVIAWQPLPQPYEEVGAENG